MHFILCYYVYIFNLYILSVFFLFVLYYENRLSAFTFFGIEICECVINNADEFLNACKDIG